MKIKTKLCGFTTKETIDLAVASDVDFIGFIFYQNSKRNISPQNAGEISKNIPPHIKKVAVFVDLNNEQISQIIQFLKPDFLQIHLNDLQRVLEIKNHFQIPIIKAFAISEKKDLDIIYDYEKIADYFLFDAKTTEVGGSGKSFDWTILNNLKTEKKWFLSGGLNANNIEEALKETQAKHIDLSSGIEEVKGIKSPKLITEFMNKIHSYNKKINKILIASGNKGKLVEIAKLLADTGIEAVLATDYNLNEPEETGKSFEENAILKAKYYGDKTGLVALADDSGLCVDLLDGQPGIHSARWAVDEKNGQKSFELAFERIRQALISKGINPEKQTINAHFICNLTLYTPVSGEIKSFEGKVQGTITFPPRGEKGFGYDPIFIASGFEKTFGEILPEEKDKISHRTKAFSALVQFLKDC